MDPRPQSSITDAEWVAYLWVEVTTFGDPEPLWAIVRERTPEEQAEAWGRIEALRERGPE
jgi:hypothetical protein